VLREIDGIEQEALGQWRALPPPNLTGQPPTLQGTGMRAVQLLGKLMNFDKNISPTGTGLQLLSHAVRRLRRADPISQSDDGRVSRNGALPGRQADGAEVYLLAVFPRTPLQRDPTTLLCGNFWDSRATGTFYSKPTPSRHSILPWIPRKWATLTLLASRSSCHRPSTDRSSSRYGVRVPLTSSSARYRGDLRNPWRAAVFGSDVTPVRLKSAERLKANEASITGAVHRCVRGLTRPERVLVENSTLPRGCDHLTADEMAGYKLFDGKGNCNSCHVDGRGTTLSPGQTDTGNAATVEPSSPASARPMKDCL